MRNNQLLSNGETIIRVLDMKNGKVFVIDCKRQSVPNWVDIDTLADCKTYACENRRQYGRAFSFNASAARPRNFPHSF